MKVAALLLIGLACFVGAIASVAAASLLSSNDTAADHRPASSRVSLKTFVLQPSGILFYLHPTDAPITLTATAEFPLKICQDGTSFSTYWKGGCRHLGRRALALPRSGGAMHVGFRVLPLRGRPTRIEALSVRWHCVDHAFAFLRGPTLVRNVYPIFDC